MDALQGAGFSVVAAMLAFACTANDIAPENGSGGADAAGAIGVGGYSGATDSGGAVFISDAGLLDVDGEADAKAPPFRGCADQQAKARYAACQSAKDEPTCTVNGGAWIVPMCNGCGDGHCSCFSDDWECVCTQAIDCLQYCLWTPSDPLLTLDLASCASVAKGTCADLRPTARIEIDTPGACTLYPVGDN
jgi:hypothetical protein